MSTHLKRGEKGRFCFQEFCGEPRVFYTTYYVLDCVVLDPMLIFPFYSPGGRGSQTCACPVSKMVVKGQALNLLWERKTSLHS